MVEKLLEEKENIIEKAGSNKSKYTYKDKFIIPGGKDLFIEVSNFIKNKTKLNPLNHSDNLILPEENPNIILENSSPEVMKKYKTLKEQDDKKRFRTLREDNSKKNLFKNYFIFCFICCESIEDALVAQLLCNFKDNSKSNKRPIDIIFSDNVNSIGINLIDRGNDKFEGYLIFAY